MSQPSPEELREMIDEAIEEIERTELEMLDLLSDVLGPQGAQLVADSIAAAQTQPKIERLERLKREAKQGPSTPPPATR